MLLRAGIGITAAIASRSTPVCAAPDNAPDVGGEFSFEPNACAAVASDFGNIIHRKPRAVLKPASSVDIASLMRWAGDRGLKVAARGQGHSTYGRALVEDGVVIDMRAINTIHHVQPDRIVVDAGATWESVLEAALAQGLTPPVLPNYLGLSVGGSIAVGGIGGTSSRYGMQTDHVLDLDVVTGDGRELTCSPNSNLDLFDAARGGLAQCCIITRVTLRLVHAPERVRRFQLFYKDLAALTADQRRVLAEGRFDQLQGAIIPEPGGAWRYQLEWAVYYEGSSIPDDETVLASLSDDRSAAAITDRNYHDDALAFAKLEALLKSKGHWFNPQPWLFTFLPGGRAEQIADDILSELSDAELGPFGRVTYYPTRTRAFHTPLVRLPDEPVAFPFNIIRIPSRNDVAKMEQAISQNRRFYEQIRKAGGVQYPVGAFPMTPTDWKEHFGARWPLLHNAKRRYDPKNLLTPGYNLVE
jgi:FAD/FMN-containing dehydrogenase